MHSLCPVKLGTTRENKIVCAFNESSKKSRPFIVRCHQIMCSFFTTLPNNSQKRSFPRINGGNVVIECLKRTDSISCKMTRCRQHVTPYFGLFLRNHDIMKLFTSPWSKSNDFVTQTLIFRSAQLTSSVFQYLGSPMELVKQELSEANLLQKDSSLTKLVSTWAA